jgi:heptosyltransferase-2
MRRPGRLPTHLVVDLPNWLGDVVMALPAVARLDAANAGGVTVLHTGSTSKRLLGLLFPRAEIVVSRRRATPSRAATLLRSQWGRFEVGLTFRHATRAKLLLAMVAWHRLGSSSDGGRVLLTEPVSVDRHRHQVFDGDPMLTRLGLPSAEPAWRPPELKALTAEGWSALPQAVRVADRAQRVGVAPTAAWGPSKRWPAERFGALAAELGARGMAPVVLVGPGEEAVAARVLAGAGRPLPVVGPSLDTGGLLGVLSLLGTVVSSDTGPMHLAALAGCRVVAVFGPTDPRRTAPLGSGHRIVRHDLPCSPCLKRRCPLKHHACLQELGVSEVVTAVTGDLDDRTSAAHRSTISVAY